MEILLMIHQRQLKKQDSMMMKIQIVLILNQNLMKTIQLQHLLLLQEIRPLLIKQPGLISTFKVKIFLQINRIKDKR